MEKHLLAAESWTGSAKSKGNYVDWRRAHFKRNKTPWTILTLVQVSGRAPWMQFFSCKVPVARVRVPGEHSQRLWSTGASPGASGEKWSPPGVCSEHEPSGSTLRALRGQLEPSTSHASSTSALPCLSCEGNPSSLSFPLCVLEQRPQHVAQCCFHPSTKRAVTVIAVGVSLRSHLVNIKGLVHQQAVTLGNGA